MAQDLEPKALDQEELAFRTKLLISQSCQTLGNPMDCSPPGSSVHGILQARILEWVAISVSRGSSHPRDQTQVSCITGRFFTRWVTRWEQKLCHKTERHARGFQKPTTPCWNDSLLLISQLVPTLCSPAGSAHWCPPSQCASCCCSLFGGEVCGTSHYGMFTALWSHSDGICMDSFAAFVYCCAEAVRPKGGQT